MQPIVGYQCVLKIHFFVIYNKCSWRNSSFFNSTMTIVLGHNFSDMREWKFAKNSMRSCNEFVRRCRINYISYLGIIVVENTRNLEQCHIQALRIYTFSSFLYYYCRQNLKMLSFQTYFFFFLLPSSFSPLPSSILLRPSISSTLLYN